MHVHARPPYTAEQPGDCDDSQPLVNPRASEICGNGLDDDCAGGVDNGCGPDCAEPCSEPCPNTADTSCGCPAPVNCIASNLTSDSSDPVDPICVDARRIVFVSRFLASGTMGTGGLAGADAACQGWVTMAPHTQALAPGATFKAWRSDGTQSPSTRFNTAGGPFVTVNVNNITTIVANDWDDLTDGTLDAYIGITETGLVPVGVTTAWTGTGTDGTGNGPNCSNWTTIAGTGQAGALFTADSGWTSNTSSAACNTNRRLFCIQQ